MAINQSPCLGIAGELYMPSTGLALKTIRSAYSLVSQLELYWVVTSSNGESNGTLLQYSCLENPWAEEPGRLQSMGSLRVGHD